MPEGKVLVTGATGFVGRALVNRLRQAGLAVALASRHPLPDLDAALVGDIDGTTDWRMALHDCDAVVHLAARVHVIGDQVHDPLSAFRVVNTQGSLNLARQAAAAGLRRLVFLSSIKVNGEGFPHPHSVSPKENGVYSEADEPAPQDAYAISKWEAEQGLRALAQETGMEVVVLRPPLVYGPGVGANFLRLLRLVERGVPLPFGAVENRRSLLYLGNLVDAIVLCLSHPAAANQAYLVSDGEDVSTPQLIRLLATYMGKRARLLPVPPGLLELAGRLVGKGAEVQRLLGSLAVDGGKIRRELGWRPPYTLSEGLAETVTWYQER